MTPFEEFEATHVRAAFLVFAALDPHGYLQEATRALSELGLTLGSSTLLTESALEWSTGCALVYRREVGEA